MFYIRQGSGNEIAFKLVQAADGYTPINGEDDNSITCKINVNNTGWSDPAQWGLAQVAQTYGIYYASFSENDVNTLGRFDVHFECVGCRNWDDFGYVIPVDTYDALFSTGTFTVDDNAIAEAVLKADYTSITGEAPRSLINATRKLMNKVALSGSSLNIYKEDGVSVAFTQSVGTNGNQQPIVSLTTT